MNKLQQKIEEAAAKRKTVAEIFEAGGEDLDLSAEQVDEVRQLNKDIEDTTKEVEGLRALEKQRKDNADAIERDGTVKRTIPYADGESDTRTEAGPVQLGRAFVESEAFRGYRPGATSGPTVTVPVNLRTLFSTTAGFATQTRPTNEVVYIAQQMPRLVDVVPSTTTDQVAVTYFEETTFTNNAAEVAEGGDYGEAALVYTKRTSPVEKVGVWIPVTDEEIADVEGTEGRLNNRLTLMLKKRIDAQIVAGDGSSPNLQGLATLSSVLTQAGTGISAMDAIYKGMVKVNATDGFAEASAICLHPKDWQDMRLLTTSDGLYLLGSPSDPDIMRLWGLPVVTSTALTENTGYVGDFLEFSELAYKAGIEFEVTNSHASYFIAGKLAIRAQLRAALTFRRATAFCKITAI